MKIINGFILFLSVLCLGSCFNPPEFPVVPQIEFNKIEFLDNPSTLIDSLIIYLDFKDGDGNLGIDAQNPDFMTYPFNELNFFQENNGTFDTLHTSTAYTQTDQYEIIDIPNPAQGKLVTFKTRTNPLYAPYMPPALHCAAYEVLGGRAGPAATGRKLLIEQADLQAIDQSVTRIVDTLSSSSDTTYYQILDTVFFMFNPDHYNIEVEFLVQEPGNPNADAQGFVKFDWEKSACRPPHGRFPVLGDQGSLEGTLSYSIFSSGFNIIFSIKTIKLRVHIKDRDRNKSNVVETPAFTLDQIRKK